MDHGRDGVAFAQEGPQRLLHPSARPIQRDLQGGHLPVGTDVDTVKTDTGAR